MIFFCYVINLPLYCGNDQKIYKGVVLIERSMGYLEEFQKQTLLLTDEAPVNRRDALFRTGNLAGLIGVSLSVPLVWSCATTGKGRVLTSSGWTSPNPSLVDRLDYVPKLKAEKVVQEYRANPKNYDNQTVVSTMLSLLGQKDDGFSLLAHQLGQLPETMGGVKASDVPNLDRLVQAYQKDPDAFDEIHKRMNKVGIEEVRRYNTPLQALFWLAQDGKQFNDLIKKSSWKKVLELAWTKGEKWKTMFTPEEYEQIREGLVGRLKDQHRVYLREYDKSAVNWVVSSFSGLFNERKKYFSWSTRSLIKKAIERSRKGGSRWGNFNTVADRLNAPYLVHYYIKSFIQYKTIPGITFTPEIVFKRGWGDSDDLASFGNYMLKTAGYKTFWEEVGNRDTIYHPGSGIILDDGSYFLVVDFRRSGNIYLNYSLSKSQVQRELRKALD